MSPEAPGCTSSSSMVALCWQARLGVKLRLLSTVLTGWLARPGVRKLLVIASLSDDLARDAAAAAFANGVAAHAMDYVPDEAERSAAIAKAHITDRFMQVARDTVEAHGGIGFTWECDVQIWFKRAMFDRAFLGTPDVHRTRAADLAGW